MNVQNLPIGRKLAGAFALLIIVFVTVGTLLFSQLASLENSADDKERSLRAMQSAREMMLTVLEQQNAVRAFSILGREEFADTYAENVRAFDQHATTFAAHSTSPEQHARLEELKRATKVLGTKLNRMIELARNPATRGEAQQMAGVKQLGEIRRLVKEIADFQEERVQMRVDAEDKAYNSAIWALGIGGVVALALAGLLGWALSRLIAKPVSDMTKVMGDLANGNNQVDVPGTERRDEIGGMAKAVLVFREAAVAKERADAAKKVADAEQKRVVGALTDGLGGLAKGDLTARIESDFGPEYAVVKSNFNQAVDSLRELIASVMESAASIRTGSGEIAQASEDLARRTESNAASLEETSAALVQIDQRLKASAEAATKTVERADGAISTVAGGRSVADDAVEAMGRVSQSAKGIDTVIEGLDKIAFQTRVLAMNAAVEAGRAGDAGRGFAVVADLVSALAMRAEEEAKRARDQLTVTQTDIITAVEMVQKVDGALANISNDVGQVHELLGTMAADNQAQSSAITQISTAIGTMDQSTQQNAAMVEETSAAARNLSTEVVALSDQASRFNVGNDNGRPRAKAPARSAPAAAARYTSPVKPLPAAAVAALTRPASDDDWKDF